MKLRNILIVGVLAVVAVVVCAFAAMAFVFGDVMSYTATGHETLSPSGASTGNALVVYDPGISGKSKDAAYMIAGSLRAKGYTVDLCGIRSADAVKAGGYDVIAVGGPVYVGNASGSVKSYLSTLSADNDTKLGVFGTGGVDLQNDDLATVTKEVGSVDSPVAIKAAMKILPEDDAEAMCSTFVGELLK